VIQGPKLHYEKKSIKSLCFGFNSSRLWDKPGTSLIDGRCISTFFLNFLKVEII
jgi:hypothetical protein